MHAELLIKLGYTIFAKCRHQEIIKVIMLEKVSNLLELGLLNSTYNSEVTS